PWGDSSTYLLRPIMSFIMQTSITAALDARHERRQSLRLGRLGIALASAVHIRPRRLSRSRHRQARALEDLRILARIDHLDDAARDIRTQRRLRQLARRLDMPRADDRDVDRLVEQQVDRARISRDEVAIALV